jgi:hypothetical protein
MIRSTLRAITNYHRHPIFARFIGMCLCFLLLFSSPRLGPAWWTQTHPRLSALSGSHYSMALKLTEISGVGYRSALQDAAVDPDEHKTLTHFLARDRALTAFTAAVNSYNEGIGATNDNRKMEKLAEATVNLGHCFHYLQDYADPTKGVNDGGRDEESSRRIADVLLHTDEIQNPEYQEILRNERLAFKTESDLAQLLDRLHALHSQHRKELIRARNENERKHILAVTFGQIVAGQNKVLDLFAARVASGINKPNTVMTFALPFHKPNERESWFAPGTVVVSVDQNGGEVTVSPSDITVVWRFDYGGGRFSLKTTTIHLQKGVIRSIASDAQGLKSLWAAGGCDPWFIQSGDQNDLGQPVKQAKELWNVGYDRVLGYCNMAVAGFEWKLTFQPAR